MPPSTPATALTAQVNTETVFLPTPQPLSLDVHTPPLLTHCQETAWFHFSLSSPFPKNTVGEGTQEDFILFLNEEAKLCIHLS